MKSIVYAAIATFMGIFALSASAHACSISGSGLNEQQLQELTVLCEQKKLEATNSTLAGAFDPDKMDAYANIAEKFAKALGTAAKELGIATNDFLETDAGKLTAAVIIWKTMGEDILGAIIGLPLVVLIILSAFYISRRLVVDSITYSEDKTTWYGRPKIAKVEYTDLENRSGIYIVSAIVTAVLVWLVVGAVIF